MKSFSLAILTTFFLFCIVQLISCGPSKAELEAAVKKQLDEAIGDTTASDVVVSTDKSEIKVEKSTQIIKTDGKGGGTLRFLTIDEHQYIQWYTSSEGSSDIGVAMCHSESCSNEIHTNTNK